MNKSMDQLRPLGFRGRLKSVLDERKLSHHEVARVISVHRDKYLISNGDIQVLAELSGGLRYTAQSAIDLPTVGDWVYANIFDQQTLAIIHGLIPRTSTLSRKRAGKETTEQLIAANVDIAMIALPLDQSLNLRRLERYLVMVHSGAIKAAILLTKADLVSPEKIEAIKAELLAVVANTPILSVSVLDPFSVASFRGTFLSAHTYCLLGVSGAGKTSLLNALLGETRFATAQLSDKTGKGKHTTTARELVALDNGALIIDTPGMREMGHVNVDQGIEDTFSLLGKLNSQCQFNNCTHQNEPGCAIQAGLVQGEISAERFDHYKQLMRESAFNDRSLAQRKERDKKLGKLIKSVKYAKNRS